MVSGQALPFWLQCQHLLSSWESETLFRTFPQWGRCFYSSPQWICWIQQKRCCPRKCPWTPISKCDLFLSELAVAPCRFASWCLATSEDPQRRFLDARQLAMSLIKPTSTGRRGDGVLFCQNAPVFVLGDRWQILWSIKVAAHLQFQPRDLRCAMKQFSFQWTI